MFQAKVSVESGTFKLVLPLTQAGRLESAGAGNPAGSAASMAQQRR